MANIRLKELFNGEKATKKPINESRELLKLNQELFKHLDQAIVVAKKIDKEVKKDQEAAIDFYDGIGLHKYTAQWIGKKLADVVEALGLDSGMIFK